MDFRTARRGRDPVPGGGLSPGAGDPLAEHTLSGEVEKVLFEAEDASFAVIRFRDAQGVSQCAAGPLPGIAPGQSVTLTGKWEIHPEYGRRLKVVSFSAVQPVTPEALIRFLSSGVLPGIGEKYASAIVNRFGADTLKVLDTASQRLYDVPGLGKKRIETIRRSWKENSSLREIRMSLQSFGITPAYFKKIYDCYGDAAPGLIRENPYRLASDIRGIGFLLADRIASHVGFEKNDSRRLLAGVSYAFDRMRTAGHVCLPLDLFLKSLGELLEVTPSDAASALREALLARTATEVPVSGAPPMIYEPNMMRIENEFPVLISVLLRRRDHLGLRLAAVPAPSETSFSCEQLAAVDRAGVSAVSILTGGPGVGKTTVVSELVRRANLAKVPVVLAAPTGRAAKRLEETTRHAASTIHRLLKWDPIGGKFVHTRDNPLAEALYVIDESSMLDLPLASCLFRAIPPRSCVVIVGDPDQLPPVGPGSVLTDLIASGLCPVSRLTRIFRQGEGSGIIRAAHSINAGSLPPAPPASREAEPVDFYWIQKDDPEDAADVIERMIAERIPARFGFDPRREIQLLCPMNRGAVGTGAMNRRLQTRLNPGDAPSFAAGERLFKQGDKVMQISNNYDKNVFNGDLGFLVEADPAAGAFSVDYDGRLVNYDISDADQIVPAYAVTVHKAQGCEFPVVILPLLSSHYMMLQRNLLYTAVTRARRLMILVGSRKAVSMAVRNTVREPRYSLLLDKLKHAMEVPR